MAMYVLFGVRVPKQADVDDVAQQIAALIGVNSVKRSGEEKGEYCTFEGDTNENIELVASVWADEDGDYTREPDFPDWSYLLYLNSTGQNSPWLKVLQGEASQFQKLRTDVIE
jgi:hypothetical protein